MIAVENLVHALGELWSNRFRSLLTTLGIVIAVAAVIAVVSILEGMTGYIKGFIRGLGSDAVWVQPYVQPGESGRRLRLDIDDCRAIAAECPAVAEACPLLQRSVKIKFRGREAGLPVIGTTPVFQTIRDWYVGRGRFWGEVDAAYRRNVCVVGIGVLEKLEADREIVGRQVRLAGRVFRVIGVLEKKGSFFGNSLDEVVLIPFSTARKVFGEQAASLLTVLARTRAAEQAEAASRQIEALLRKRHKLKPSDKDDFRVQTQDQMLGFFNQASRLTTFVLAGIVGISLVVGGIGIMNIMLVSVTERTREIGVLKALGARDKDILLQFLIEALLLALLGGAIGVVLGAAIGYGASALSPLPAAKIPLWAVALGFAFSAGVGVFFGMYPAVKAARLNPIEALRYE